MYIFIGDKKLIKPKKKASEIIGLAFPTLSNILNQRVACKKTTAYCITKYIDSEAEIEDFFKKVK